ncbi:hypothetical protein BV25DRAFT_963050 [Artomyces pyxidatus]|uniref:Uncharacterized protein n=1 Tax=Artomyces pyxidatus TaxID=48021 RepID=A0ACB8SXN8_9AGAM|nr:hypothetical protein BV25DRAFT_963050 [Artomyces pyxidatus]
MALHPQHYAQHRGRRGRLRSFPGPSLSLPPVRADPGRLSPLPPHGRQGHVGLRFNSVHTPTYWRNRTPPSPPPSPTPTGRKAEPTMLASSSSSSIDLAVPNFMLPITPPASPPPFVPSHRLETLHNELKPNALPPTPKSLTGSSVYVRTIPAPSTPTNQPLSYLNDCASEPSLVLLASTPLKLPAPGVFDETEEGVHLRTSPHHRSWIERGIVGRPPHFLFILFAGLRSGRGALRV